MNTRLYGPRRRGRKLRWLAAAVVALAACSGSEDPGVPPAPVDVSYAPQAVSVALLAGEEREFAADVTGASSYEVAWSVDGDPAGNGARYTFAGENVGSFVLRVQVTAGEYRGERVWSVTVSPDESTLPPPVDDVTAEHGDAPGEVVLRWYKSDPNPDGYPFAAFLVAVSYAGPVDETSWAQADFTVERAPGPSILQELVMSAPEYDIRPGERAWFGVRVRDERGQLSHLDDGASLEISSPWTLDVLLLADDGTPLAANLLSYDCGDCAEGVRNAVTGADGRLRLGPFRSIDPVVVTTKSADTDGVDPPAGWFDFVTQEIGAGTGEVTIVLPARYALDLVSCGASEAAVNFMDYLLKMTRTDAINPADPDRRLLHSWASYPVGVWFTPEELASVGAETGVAMRQAAAAWNTAAGEELMVEVADSSQAGIVVRLDTMPDNIQGRLRVIADGAYRTVGSVQPERANVLLNRAALASRGELAVVTMHELGHALGLLSHSCPSGKGNLMDNGGLGASAIDPLDPADWHTLIGATELRAVRAVRNLGAGVPMTGYETE